MEKTLRNSNLELYRIIVMLLIIMHHYVVNSGLWDVILQNKWASQSIFLYLFGMWGKTGINCFVLITGYFMCTKDISASKFFRLVFEVLFYTILFYIVFAIAGYYEVSIKSSFFLLVRPFRHLRNDFVSCFIVFYLFIPFLNILIKRLTSRQHLLLIILCMLFYSLLPSMHLIKISYSYVTWFMVLYFISSYLRFYWDDLFEKINTKYKIQNTKFWVLMSIFWVTISVLSVFVAIYLNKDFTFFVADSNKLLAVMTSISLFMCFKDLKIKPSGFINTISASVFGVLLIHANSDTMRQWLWRDTLDNVGHYYSQYLWLHAICSVIGVYIVCTIIDLLRIKFIEKPFFKAMEKRINDVEALIIKSK